MAKPILKWAGGKAALLPQIKPFLPDRFDRYVEPFFGGGAMFFAVGYTAERVVLSDINAELIELYEIVRVYPLLLIPALEAMERDYLAKDGAGRAVFYYSVRATSFSSAIKRAARTIFLNKTGYNGAYRVNSKGGFNIPHGRPSGNTDPKICDRGKILKASTALQNRMLLCSSFRSILDLTDDWAGTFAYLDPPYHPISKTSNFTGYQPGGFSEQDQRDVAELFKSLADRGAKVVLSNSDCEFTRSLYAGYRIESISRSGSISCKAGGRGRVGEILVLSY